MSFGIRSTTPRRPCTHRSEMAGDTLDDRVYHISKSQDDSGARNSSQDETPGRTSHRIPADGLEANEFRHRMCSETVLRLAMEDQRDGSAAVRPLAGTVSARKGEKDDCGRPSWKETTPGRIISIELGPTARRL